MAQVARRVVGPADVEAAAKLAAGGGVRGRGGLRHRVGNPAGLADLPAARQHRAPRPRRGLGDGRAAAGGAGAVRRRLRRAVPHPAAGRTGPTSGWRRSWPRSGCGCIPTRPGSSYLAQGRGGLRLPRASTIGRWSRGSGGVATTCNSWPSARAMNSIRAKIRERDRPPLRRARPVDVGGRRPQPRAAGLGRYFRRRATPPGSSPPSTATSTSGWPSSPAPSTAVRDATGAAGSTCGWLQTPRRLPAHRNGRATGLRMPDDERCRRAVCGRTACTVRQGAAGDSDAHGETDEKPAGQRRSLDRHRPPQPAAYLTRLLPSR